MDFSSGLLQPTRRAPPPPGLPSALRLTPSALSAETDSSVKGVTEDSPSTSASSTPASRPKLSQSLSMPFVRRPANNHVDGKKKAPPPRPPPPKITIPSNRLKNNSSPDTNVGSKEEEAVLIDLSPPRSSSGSSSLISSISSSDQQQFSLLDAPISSYISEESSNHGLNGHIKQDPFGSIEDSSPLGGFCENQALNSGSNGHVSNAVKFPNYMDGDMNSQTRTMIDWNSRKSTPQTAYSEHTGRPKSHFYTENDVGGSAFPRYKKKPTIIRPKNVTVSCVAQSQPKEVDFNLSAQKTKAPMQLPQPTSSKRTAVAEFDFESSETGDLHFQAGDVIEVLAVVNSEWLEGRLNGTKGIFPASFVKVVDSLAAHNGGWGSNGAAAASVGPSPASSQTTALYGFNAEMPTDLPLKEGETVTVTAIVEGGQWLLGHSGGRTGQFPANFVAHVPPNLPIVTL